ncbi:hypothetical protein JWZ98_09945 [Methylomonas sp. EFPC1]|uniref:hypothetical protein n=1 Tax=Methylomonas sp. EFPC1 TaxID=2812647 RepID=UPI0019685E98|nr:hypothetical protein [Methylomonas sp. EFPC1]QSB03219.1 hypothetical protein JWZ98_09945 [Methylomonas sp. EFPC1]
MAGGLLSDTAYMANRFSWQGTVILGVVQFIVFYWLLPTWINHQLDSLQGNMFRPMVEVIFAKRVHWLQWLAMALALICGFFAIRNYFAVGQLDRYGERQVGFISRLLARWFD